MIKKVLILMALVLCATFSWASIKVSGIVVSKEDGEPVIGASVLEKNTSNGTITDFDGKFVLTVEDKAILVISYVGMTTQEVKATPNMKVVLQTDAIAMAEKSIFDVGREEEKGALTPINDALERITWPNLNLAGVTVANKLL